MRGFRRAGGAAVSAQRASQAGLAASAGRFTVCWAAFLLAEGVFCCFCCALYESKIDPLQKFKPTERSNTCQRCVMAFTVNRASVSILIMVSRSATLCGLLAQDLALAAFEHPSKKTCNWAVDKADEAFSASELFGHNDNGFVIEFTAARSLTDRPNISQAAFQWERDTICITCYCCF